MRKRWLGGRHFHMDLIETTHSAPTKLKADPKPVRTKFDRHARRKAAKQDKEFVQAVRRVVELVFPSEALDRAQLRSWGYELYGLKKITKKQARLLGCKVR